MFKSCLWSGLSDFVDPKTQNPKPPKPQHDQCMLLIILIQVMFNRSLPTSQGSHNTIDISVKELREYLQALSSRLVIAILRVNSRLFF
jgi:hypothetical protein